MSQLKYTANLYPTEDQEQYLSQVLGCTRKVWNIYLDRELQTYAKTGKYNFYNNNAKHLTELKKQPQYAYLNKAPAVALQQSLKRLDVAIRAFLKARKEGNFEVGFPTFKSKKAARTKESFTLVMVNAKQNIKNTNFHVTKDIGITTNFYRPLPSDFKSVQVVKDNNEWYASFTCETTVPALPKTNKIIGIDLNSEAYVSSNNDRYVVPKATTKKKKYIKKLQRKLKKAQKGSNNRKKINQKLKKAHSKTKNVKKDFLHKLTKQLLIDNDTIVLEDLDVKKIQRGNYSRVIQQNGFAIFRAMLEYKAKLYGKEVYAVDRYFPSTQLCSHCGNMQKMPTDYRVYDCVGCGASIDRDLNAAINMVAYYKSQKIQNQQLIRAGTAQREIGGNADSLYAFGDTIGGSDENTCIDLDAIRMYAAVCDIVHEGSYVL